MVERFNGKNARLLLLAFSVLITLVIWPRMQSCRVEYALKSGMRQHEDAELGRLGLTRYNRGDGGSFLVALGPADQVNG
ncbi:hypothetical protein SY88_09760 [Clostridiales bacterium PH28_bin88]|nr:hypothetical protein SY88_09760 [Clostridiales bacterium PH28_bin88]